jgi:hypothetical protein
MDGLMAWNSATDTLAASETRLHVSAAWTW